MAQRVTADDFSEKALGFSGLSIVDFYSDSCIPCKRMSPVLSAIEEKYGDKVLMVKVNVAYDAALAEQYEVTSTPTFLFFRNGQEVERFSGVKKKEEFEQLIEAVL